MSRLIFEGDTTKRFGEKFPRPFIEQVRAYDNALQVDIAFYFKVPNEQQKVNSFVQDLKNGSLSQSIVLSSINQATLDRVRLGRNFDTLVKTDTSGRPSTSTGRNRRSSSSTGGTGKPSTNTEEILTKIISFADFVSGQETPPRESSSYSSYNVAIKDDFYSLDGTRYIKIFGTLIADYNSSDELYITCFVKNREKYENQNSDLIFEKVLNKDRTITKDPIVAFKEQNDTFYYQQPLMSLSRRYHKTDDYGHTEMIKQFSDVLSGYSIDESNDLLTLLDTESTNPRLLILIKNKIENFTDKSPATPVGRLYSQLASNIVLADSLINRQEIVNKRQFTNKKIVDRRTINLPNLNKEETYGPFYGEFYNLNWFLPKPLISRNLFPFYDSQNTDLSIDISTNPPANISGYFKIQTSAYYFFDFEKTMNYRSQISNFINPYNIEQIFGKGSLVNHFYFSNCSLDKIPLKAGINTRQLLRKKKYYLDYIDEDGSKQKFGLIQSDSEADVNYHRLEGSQGKIKQTNWATFITFKKSEQETLYSTLMQRGFDTHKGLNGYRLSLFELQDYQVAGKDGLFLLENIDLDFNIEIKDRTMEFYDVHIRQKIFSILQNIENYYNYASDFCSYNNIDGRFNDFFLQNIRNQFDEPYPWVEAPFYYYAFLQMMIASINEDGTRRRDGTLLDLESIRQASIELKDLISPETGNLEDLKIFYENLKSLVENYFTQGSGLDEGGEIYLDTSEAPPYKLINSDINLNFSRTDRFFADNISSDFSAEEIEELEDYNLPRCAELILETRDYEAKERVRQGNPTGPIAVPSTSEIESYESKLQEIEQRKCYDVPLIKDVMKCNDYANKWRQAKSDYDSAKRLENSEARGQSMNESKRNMEDWLSWYQNSDCVQLIGPINEYASLEKDFEDAGVI